MTDTDSKVAPQDPGHSSGDGQSGRHWSRWTWLLAALLLVLGSVVAYTLLRSAPIDSAITTVALEVVVVTITLAVLGGLSVRHRSGAAATTAALFASAVLMVPLFVVAGVVGVRDRVAAGLDGVLSEFNADIGGDTAVLPEDDPAAGEDDVVDPFESEGEDSFGEGAGAGAAAPPWGFGDDPELDTLWTMCENGNADACDQLYMSSEAGSDYEEFGFTCGGRVQEGTPFCEDVMD